MIGDMAYVKIKLLKLILKRKIYFSVYVFENFACLAIYILMNDFYGITIGRI